MKTLFLFGNQLFDPEIFPKNTIGKIVMVESRSMWRKFKYHKIKLAFVTCAMRDYADELVNLEFKLDYFTYDNNKNLEYVVQNYDDFLIYETSDKDPINNFKLLCKKYNKKLEVLPNPNFLTTVVEFESWAEGKKKFFFNNFYIWQRKRLNILVENGEAIGGKWSTDEQNREKLKAKIKSEIDENYFTKKQSKHFDEVKKIILKNFAENPGQLNDLWLPTNRKDAELWFDNFLKEKLKNFGPYEDAIDSDLKIIFHSGISALLNIGLLNPDYVVKHTLKYAHSHHIPYSSLEGFLRQIIGWREFVHCVYWKIGDEQKKSNFFNHTRKITKEYYDATTGIIPIDNAIKKVNEMAYSHHIERLMIMGNWMLLKKIAPNEVYRWFMEMYIDAYEWVMIPNVYGMSQFADGGLMVTKPYFSSSNYILKMSNYKKGDWSEKWDKLFWDFMEENKEYLSKNPRLKMLLITRKNKISLNK